MQSQFRKFYLKAYDFNARKIVLYCIIEKVKRSQSCTTPKNIDR